MGSSRSKVRTNLIDMQLKDDLIKDSKQDKILLLGTGQSGKSTIVKQMKILHLNGFSEKELLDYRNIVFDNTIDSLKDILQGMYKLGIEFAINERRTDAKQFLSVCEYSTELNEDFGCLMKRIWLDADTQACFFRSREYQLADSAK